MKAATIYRLSIGIIIVCALVLGASLLPAQAKAEDNGYSQAAELYSQAELAQMLAPIALYPDALLSQILMASTYPIEVIEADRWRKNNPHLQDETLDDALANQYWDPSVKALCHFPDLLALMSERIGETTDLGNAFLAQEKQVMDTVQHLRAAAYAEGNLTSSSRQRVVVEKEIIIIQPADPRIIYVPYYDPYTIYGRWRYPAYSPWYWGPPRVSIGFGIGYWPGFYFSFSSGNWSYFNWHRHYVHIDVHNRPRYVRRDHWVAKPGRWHHTPTHRRGVAYRAHRTASKYGQSPRATSYRRDTRGVPQRRELVRTERNVVHSRQELQRAERRRTERAIQLQRRVQSDRQRNAVTEQTRQERAKVETNRSIRVQVERDRRQRDKISRQVRQQRKIEQNQPTATPRLRKQSQQIRLEPNRAFRKPAVQSRTKPQRVQQAAPFRRQVERQQPRDNAFTRVDQGAKERQSSQRGRASRQDRSGNSRSDRGSNGAEQYFRDRSRR